MKTHNLETPEESMVEILTVAEKIADHTNKFQAKTIERAERIERRVLIVEKEVGELKKVAQKLL